MSLNNASSAPHNQPQQRSHPVSLTIGIVVGLVAGQAGKLFMPDHPQRQVIQKVETPVATLSARITKDLDEYEQFLDQKANGHVYLLAIERHMDGLASFLETMIARKKFATRTLDNVNSAQISILFAPEEAAKIPDTELQKMAERARDISRRASERMEHLPPIDVPPGGGGGFF